jgi:ketosteroid isomerase-like protein
MAKPNVEVVREIIAAFNREDLDAAMKLCDPEIKFDWSRRLLDPGVFQGQQGLRRFFEGFREVFERVEIEEADEIVERADQVIWIGRAHFRGRTSGADVAAYGAQLWTVHNGKAVGFRFYQTRQEALDALKPERPAARLP